MTILYIPNNNFNAHVDSYVRVRVHRYIVPSGRCRDGRGNRTDSYTYIQVCTYITICIILYISWYTVYHFIKYHSHERINAAWEGCSNNIVKRVIISNIMPNKILYQYYSYTSCDVGIWHSVKICVTFTAKIAPQMNTS